MYPNYFGTAHTTVSVVPKAVAIDGLKVNHIHIREHMEPHMGRQVMVA